MKKNLWILIILLCILFFLPLSGEAEDLPFEILSENLVFYPYVWDQVDECYYYIAQIQNRNEEVINVVDCILELLDSDGNVIYTPPGSERVAIIYDNTSVIACGGYAISPEIKAATRDSRLRIEKTFEGSHRGYVDSYMKWPAESVSVIRNSNGDYEVTGSFINYVEHSVGLLEAEFFLYNQKGELVYYLVRDLKPKNGYYKAFTSYSFEYSMAMGLYGKEYFNIIDDVVRAEVILTYTKADSEIP